MESKDKILFRQALAFYGKIIASLSHELNNAIAIINEHNGLLDDILLGFKQEVPIDDKKLQRISHKVSSQLERAKNLIKRLNNFAHSSDNEVAEFELSEILQTIIVLTQRMADLRGVRLEFRCSEQPINIVSNPFYIQYAVFTCFELFMASADADRMIVTSAKKTADTAVINILGPYMRNDEITAALKAELQMLLQQLDGSLEIQDEPDGRQSLIISLKSKR